MKNLRKFNEASDKIPEIVTNFEESYKRGKSSFNIDYYSSVWDEVRTEYHLYDDYYLYRDAVFILETKPSGDWYHTELVKIYKPLHVFKEDVYKRIEELESAFNKL